MSQDQLRDYLNRVTVDLRRARKRLRELEDREKEPIAIVGMSCRYPGEVNSPEELWALVERGIDGIGSFPEDRGWDLDALYGSEPDRSGTSYVREGGFLHDVGEFDADFFEISPREALAMDPQQRLLLETCWEACEHAGLDPHALRDRDGGVFMGMSAFGYGFGAFDRMPELQGYRITGSTFSVASGRIAYTLGLRGPAISLDTACSSSLVALHLACQALRRGECSLALAGGVAVMAGPEIFVDFSRQQGLAPDGRCKSFADAADGTGWAEGVGVLLLERLSDAQRLGHRVLATVRGSAVNQDGASNGLTAPSGVAQRLAIEAALADARLSANDIDAVEAHGTGTTLGDPIEAQALLAAYGKRDPDRPLWLGSLKSNIGHTQAAAGVGGVIKMVMALRHQTLPETLHVDRPSRNADWSRGAVSLLTSQVRWPAGGWTRRAGISSFGISGTNAHVILEEAPVHEPPAVEPVLRIEPGELVAWPLSGRGTPALRAQAQRLCEHLGRHPEHDAVDVARSLSLKPAFASRAIVLGDSRKELLEGLHSLACDARARNLLEGAALGAGGSPVWIFPGQGAQWQGMAAGLLERSALFRRHMADCQDALAPFVDWSLEDVLRPQEDSLALERVDVVQPALFAVMVCLAELWRACGVHPRAVVGHSQGEIAAAHVAGGLSLDDAARIVALRSTALRALAGRGGMVSMRLSPTELPALFGECEPPVALAAINGPSSIVVSGELEAVEQMLKLCCRKGVEARRIPVDYAAHSSCVEALREQLVEGCAPVRPRSGSIPFYSTVSARLLDTAELDAEYWYRNLRETVQLEPVTRALLEAGERLFVEVSPHPVLAMSVQETADKTLAGSQQAAVIGSLRRNEQATQGMLRSLSEAWVHGASVDWRAVLGADGTAPAGLPTYAFQRRRYWLEPSGGKAFEARTAGLADSGHPLLGACVSLADGEGWLFTGRLSLETHPWLADHVVRGQILLPGTVLLELALHVGTRLGCEVVSELTQERPLALGEREAIDLQVAAGHAHESGERPLAIHSRPAGEAGERDLSGHGWTRHASAVLAAAQPGDAALDAATAADLRSAWPPPGAVAVPLEGFYDRLAGDGLDYGPCFRGLRAVWRRGDELFAEISPGEELLTLGARFGVHPALLDAVLHAALLAVPDGKGGESDGTVRLPFCWRDVALHATGAGKLRARVTVSEENAVSAAIADDTGALLAHLGRVLMREAPRERLDSSSQRAPAALFRVAWTHLTVQRTNVEEADGGGPSGQALAVLGQLPAGANTGSREAQAYASLAELQRAMDGGGSPPAVVLARPASSPDEGRDCAALAHEYGAQTLELLHAWLADTRFSNVRLVLFSEGAVAVSPDDCTPHPAVASVWGLVRVAQEEHPGRFVLLDLDSIAASWEALAGALALDEPQLALRAGETLVPRLTSAAPDTDPAPGAVAGTAAPAAPWRGSRFADLAEGDSVLISGGTGVLGSLLAKHLVTRHGVRELVLASRRGVETPGAQELSDELVALGASVTVTACDFADRDDVKALLDAVSRRSRLRAVIHMAGVLDDGVLGSLTPGRLDRVLAPKVDGAWHLHELTQKLDLAAFVLFSAAAGVFGGAGQGSYAAANAFLDALAAERRTRGLPGLSIAWGLWSQESGMTAHLGGSDRGRLRREGFGALATEEALELFDAACQQERAGTAAIVAARLELPELRARARAGTLPALLRSLIGSWRRPRPAGMAQAFDSRLEGLSEQARAAAVLALVREEAAAVLGHVDPGAVAPEQAFRELGFDSLLAVELRNRVEAATGLRLPATLAFDHPTAAALAEYLLAQLSGAALVGARRRPVTAMGGASREPIAIVGMACRYPGGVSSPEELWQLVESGGDAISAFPDDRGWDLDAPFDSDLDRMDASHSHEGGFLYDAAHFDPAFFGIGPSEALAMDPQQRLMLEACWEAVERGRIDPASLRGSATGVFAGVMYHDYYAGSLQSAPAAVRGYLGVGTAGSVVSGRVAYALGLEGPALTIDTACSSSLVALHLACQALRAGECELALAGGVTVLSSPAVFAEFSQQRGLARDGRCKSFANAADGAGFSEGAGVLLVERLSDALRRGRRVLAVVRGSAVNQDGASNGLTAPNGPSQERVIRDALANAELSAQEVDAVEAHGTGTSLGDPIEAQALLSTYGAQRGDRAPLWLGSVKSNIGHAQAAAGVAGVIKVVMALQHEMLPPTLHVDEPSRAVDWSQGAVALLTQAVPWPRGLEPRRVGVSSFGISGTNAHVIVEEPPLESAASGARAPLAGYPEQLAAVREGATIWEAPHSHARGSGVLDSGCLMLWPLSGRGEPALRAQAQRLHAYLSERPQADPRDVALSLAAKPTFESRAAVLGRTREELLGGLESLAHGERSRGVVRDATGAGESGGLVWVFPGQGSQWAGMAVDLLERSAVFRDHLRECEQALAPFVDWSLEDVLLRSASDDTALERVDVVQPVLFAVMVSLAGLWRACGVRPDAVVGHSQGEIAAAHVAGALSLQDAARVVSLRSRALTALAGHGGMVSLALETHELETLLADCDGSLAVAAINGPRSVVVSGAAHELEELLESWLRRDIRARRIPVDYAAHSHAVEAIREPLLEGCAAVHPRPSDVPFYSTVTGDLLAPEELGCEYWYRNLRETVQLEQATRKLLEHGFTSFIEVSPHPVLSVAVQETAERALARPEKVRALGSLRRDEDGQESFMRALGAAWAAGAPVDWRAVAAGEGRREIDLPTYAFRRERYWLAAPPQGRAGVVHGGVEESDGCARLLRLDWAAIRALRSEWDATLLDPVRCTLLGKQSSPLARALRELGMSVAVQPGLSALAGEHAREDGQPHTVVFDATGSDACPDGGGGVVDAAHELLYRLLATVQELSADVRFASCRLAVVTRDALAVRAGDGLGGLPGAAAWGLVRSAQSENPGCLALVDVDGAESSWRALAPALRAAFALDEPQLAVRDGSVLAPRLTRAQSQQRAVGSLGALIGEERSVLITGGTSGLGALIARHLAAAHDVGSVVLASRRGPNAPGAPELQRELESHGVRVTVAACDVSDSSELAELIASMQAERPLGGVIHAAGAIDDGVIGSLTRERLDRVLEPKLDAAWHLHELTERLDLAVFVLFSSAAGTLGWAGQGNYAAANAFLDGLAAHRRARGLPATSLAWGLWAEATGLTAGLTEADLSRMARSGMRPLASEEGLTLFDSAFGLDDALLLPVRLDISALRVQGGPDRIAAPLRALVGAAAQEPHVESATSFGQRLAGLSRLEREAFMLELVQRETAAVLGNLAASAVDPERAFKELGFSSLAAVELRNRLSSVTGLRLPTTLAFDYPAPAALAQHLLGSLSPELDDEDEHEREIRRAIATIPLSRLRDAGLIESLMRLAQPSDGETVGCDDAAAALGQIETMDVEGLVQRALRGSAAG